MLRKQVKHVGTELVQPNKNNNTTDCSSVPADLEFTSEGLVIRHFAFRSIGDFYTMMYDNKWQPMEFGYKKLQVKQAR